MDAKDKDPTGLVQSIAAQHDRAAFAVLFELYAGRIKAWLMRSGTPAELAEEIAQETLLTVWRKAELYDPARATVSAWLFAIARNARIDRVRRDARARQHLLYDLIEPEEPDRPDAISRRGGTGGKCSRRTRPPAGGAGAGHTAVLFRRPCPQRNRRLLGIPLGTVKSRLRLAMARLRQILGDLT